MAITYASTTFEIVRVEDQAGTTINNSLRHAITLMQQRSIMPNKIYDKSVARILMINSVIYIYFNISFILYAR